jgi:hypothetical protein
MRHGSLIGELRAAYLRDGAVRLFLVMSAVLFAFNATRAHGATFALVLVGWGLYLLEEYVSHVLVFHGFVPKSRRGYLALYRLHLGHHDRPRRVDLLFTPLWYTLPMLALNAAVFALVTRDVVSVTLLSQGLIAGYLLFEWCHLVVHSPLRPGPILAYVRKQHHGHHHWNEKRWYTISPPAIAFDFLFGTGGEVSSAPRSADPERSGVAEGDERLVNARLFYRSHTDWTEHESRLWTPPVRPLGGADA